MIFYWFWHEKDFYIIDDDFILNKSSLENIPKIGNMKSKYFIDSLSSIENAIFLKESSCPYLYIKLTFSN